MNLVGYNKDMLSNMHIPVYKSTGARHFGGLGAMSGEMSLHELISQRRRERKGLSVPYCDDELSLEGECSRHSSSYRDIMNAHRKKQHIHSVLDLMGRRHKKRRVQSKQYETNIYKRITRSNGPNQGDSKVKASEAYRERGRRLAIPDNKMRTTYKDMMKQVGQTTPCTDINNNKVYTSRRGKFLARVTLIILLLRMAKTYIFSESDRQIVNLYTAMDAAQAADSYKIQNDLVFDITRFKASKKRRVSKATKRVLNIKPGDRKEADIYHVQVELQRHKPLGRFPIEMQKRLIEKSWFEAYEQHRVVIRFNHRPWTFYVILSGSAVVLEGDPSNIGRGAIPINAGDTFGEKAITDRSRHQITVISKEHIELMCLSVEDYIDIFLAGGMNKICANEDNFVRSKPNTIVDVVNQPQKQMSDVSLTNQLNSFLRSIRIFDSWPVHLLQSNPEKCTFNFYKPKAIVVENNRTSEWIYLIKSGSCAVMKALQHKVEQVEDPVVSPKTKKYLAHHRLKRQEHPFGYHENIIKQNTKAFFKMRAELLKGKWIRPAERPSNIIQIHVRAETQVHDDGDKIVEEENSNESEAADDAVEEGESGSRGNRLNTVKTAQKDMKEVLINFKRGPFYTRNFTHGEQEEIKSRSKDEEKCDEVEDVRKTKSSRQSEPVALNISRNNQNTTSYVKIDTLEKGDVFGVLEIAFGEQPKLFLISNGAECVLISKKFFIQHCTEETVKSITDNMRPYPNDDTSRRDVQEKLNWRKKRDLTMQEVVENFKRNIRLRTQIRP
ncbi:uncharacterized protein LOC117102570 [Anneissia japonica]|uniref:uncharacterized protein LOC117102570 n=1 Tax=Anneissia japonica TaxID=1529436 RepID=UPI001425A336|nr:uncharacterized protein LOC117102570 [Anneissia japonica]XP_033098780.1 uncharacterized protein LOC117102570 [Anneissia japonica]XP_033098782.1 uncharacterized protein LOC117102570 [Anneissia japonica]XP_033098783.1 uncharacterized protein LOC117102570 [Anneissia japonica]XP_033098784.1 uncharacterized protein LOC117102570 [Anneissia japonica]